MWLSLCWFIITFFFSVQIWLILVNNKCVSSKFPEFRTCSYQAVLSAALLSLPWSDVEEHWKLSEDSASLCSIIHHLWLQNSLGSPRGYALYPDGKSRRAAESAVYSAASRSTGVYNQSLHFHAHIRAIKNKSKPA